jgi:N-acetyl-anhydromuramyl-L-alanine amidase AmpD
MKIFYRPLREVSIAICRQLKIAPNPIAPKRRLGRWANGRCAVGVAYHYTGGPDGTKSARWFNDPKWKNEGSSAHVLILDRCAGPIGRTWERMVTGSLRRAFPVPTLLLADFSQSTWCSNWANPYCLGVELRNCGYNIDDNPGGKYSLKKIGKTAIKIDDRYYEPYTRQQMVSAINIGRMVAHISDEDFDPNWIIGHHCIRSDKNDPGPHFPIQLVRYAIEGDESPENIDWLEGFENSPTHREEKISGSVDFSSDCRATDGYFCFDDPQRNVSLATGEEVPLVTCALHDMGYNIGPGVPTKNVYSAMIKMLQRSSYCQKKPLDITGEMNKSTMDFLIERIKTLRLNHDPWNL